MCWRIFQDLFVSSSGDELSLSVQRLFKNKSADTVGNLRTPRVHTSSNECSLRRLMRRSYSTANDTYRSILICESVLGKCPSIRWWAGFAPVIVTPLTQVSFYTVVFVTRATPPVIHTTLHRYAWSCSRISLKTRPVGSRHTSYDCKMNRGNFQRSIRSSSSNASIPYDSQREYVKSYLTESHKLTKSFHTGTMSLRICHLQGTKYLRNLSEWWIWSFWWLLQQEEIAGFQRLIHRILWAIDVLAGTALWVVARITGAWINGIDV